ncbi:MAG: amidohydrolase [Synergistales bacterium]|nr:amidohydrolase [Synergistales bacterium]MDY6401618.1 amidohydrolase [Synergistales bacterium]MDY6404314.1 amidohydrolase [Synergistales bacterium]MDY6410672.1 amidohydrolase [Synergistales bacterium]MDY6414015.1 amidohydrolase [Synergistales bacterium]
MATLFKDVLITDGAREKARRVHMLVSKGRIAEIIDADKNPPSADKIISGRGKMAVIPGFVNAHTHAAMTLLRGLGEEAPLMEWLQNKIWPVEEKLTPEYIYWGTLSAMLEMLSTGTTCFADMYFEMEQVAEAVLSAGMRAAICRGITAGEPGKIEKSIQNNLDLAEKYHGREGLITVQLGPHAPYTVPLEYMKKICAEAKSHGLGVHFHFMETEGEKNNLGMPDEKYLEESGLLSAPYVALAHAVWLDTNINLPENFTLVHNPSSNLKLGSGVMPLHSWLEKGTHSALGTDGASSNNRLDMWEEMRMTGLIHKGVNKDPLCVTAVEALRMATYEGARAFGFSQKGMLNEGWVADLVLINLDKPHYIGVNEENLAQYLVYAGSSADVEGTMINGRWIYKNGEFPTLDKEEIFQKAKEAREAITK